MTKPKNRLAINKEIEPEYVRMYYEHQYSRIEKNETNAINISNIVLTISALIITFGINNQSTFGSITILFLPVIIIIANIFAIIYIADNERWIGSHRRRAKRLLESLVPELYKLDQEVVSSERRHSMSRRRIQYIIHALFIFMSSILIVLFSLENFGGIVP